MKTFAIPRMFCAGWDHQDVAGQTKIVTTDFGSSGKPGKQNIYWYKVQHVDNWNRIRS